MWRAIPGAECGYGMILRTGDLHRWHRAEKLSQEARYRVLRQSALVGSAASAQPRGRSA